jgi:hypothetical protein
MKILPTALLLLAFACASKGRAPATVEEPGKIVAEAELGVGRAVEAASPPPALLLELRTKGPVPMRLSDDLRAGRTWLRVEGPRGFSFAGRALLAGEGPFRPSTASLLFVQPREGEAKGGEPALLRLGGVIDAKSLASRIETIPPPAAEDADELAKVESADLRVLLGHGLDVLLIGAGSGETDTHHWIRVVDAQGAPAAWQPALAAARQARRLDELAPYRVLVRRRRPGDPVPVHYSVRLSDIVVAAQARLVPRKDAFEWIWEGVWSARLLAPAPEGPPAWPDTAPALVLRYKEYVRPSGDATGAFWHALLAPLALGADIGAAFLEGDQPLADSVAERQRQRN